MADVYQPPPPLCSPPDVKLPSTVSCPPCPQHCAIPWKDGPVQETHESPEEDLLQTVEVDHAPAVSCLPKDHVPCVVQSGGMAPGYLTLSQPQQEHNQFDDEETSLPVQETNPAAQPNESSQLPDATDD